MSFEGENRSVVKKRGTSLSWKYEMEV